MSTPTREKIAAGNTPLAMGASTWTWALRTVLLAGCAAATIDIVFAFVFFGWTLGITPVRVLQSVATGWYGRVSFEGGMATAAVGLISHYIILIVAAWFYYLASRRLSLLNRAPLACGVAFGVAIYVAMTFVIVPLSATPARALTLSVVSVGQFLIHPVIGIAISMIVRRRASAGARA
ncbi:MAG TPA: hypothetical protein VGH81_00940 [Rudaea sp.]